MRKALAATVAVLFVVMNIQSVHAVSISSSPASVSDNIDSSSTESWNIGITPDDNIHTVSATIVGSNAENDAVFQEMLSIWPNFWASIENGVQENTTLTADTTGIAAGTYTGTIEISAAENTKSIALTFTVGVPASPTTGLTPSRGRIVATMPSTATLEKSIVITNLTGHSLTSIDAYMATTELYGPQGTDWVVVQFEAPYTLAHGATFTVTADITPQDVPNGEHERTLTVEGWYDTTQVTADIGMRITIYGAVTEISSTDISMTTYGSAVTEVTAGETVTFTLDPVASIKIYAGGTLLGTTDENGVLEADAPSSNGSYTIEARADNGSTIGSATLDVMEYKNVSITLDEVQISVGDVVTGKVFSGSQTLSGIQVILGSTTVYTDQTGEFSIPTVGMIGSSYNLTTGSLTSEYVTYRPASSTVILNAGSTPMWIWGIAVLVGVIIFLTLFKLFREGKLSWLEEYIKKIVPRGGKPKIPTR